MESTYIGKVEDGAMVEAPVYESHARGKNWMATIEADPAAPGGLAREFVKKGRGRYFYIVNASLIGKAVEIAADYTSSGGKRRPHRWYGVVRALTSEEIRIEHYETAARAIAASRTGPDRQALEEERSALLARLAEINALLEEAHV